MWEHNKQVISEFRANHGKVSGRFENVDVALLTMIDATTGIQWCAGDLDPLLRR